MKIKWTVAIVAAAMLLSAAVGMATEQGQGKGGGKKDDITYIGQMTIHDQASGAAGLHSDMRTRLDGVPPMPLPDGDGDGFADLSLIIAPDAVYQDRRLSFPASGYSGAPDPCVEIEVASGGPSAGALNADLDRGAGDAFRNCAIFEESGTQPFADDARTYSVVIDKADPGGTCVCQNFSFLGDDPEDYGWPVGSQWGTGFEDSGDFCTITPAAGPILTSRALQLTGNPRINGRVFAQSKVRGQVEPATETRLNIVLNADQPFADDPDQLSSYNFRSVNEDLGVAIIDADTREVTASTQDFRLVEFSGNDPVCPGTITIPLQITFKRFESGS